MKPAQHFVHSICQRLNDVIEAASAQQIQCIQSELEQEAFERELSIPSSVTFFFQGFRTLREGLIPEALNKFATALSRCNNNEIPEVKYYVEYGVGVALLRLSSYSEAIVAFTKARECHSLGNDKLTCRIDNNLGYIFLETEDYSKAHYYFDLAFKQDSEPSSITSMPVLSNLAFVNSKLGNFQKADELFALYRNALKQYPNVIGEYFYFSAYASHLEINQDIDAALNAFTRAIECARSLNETFFLICTLKEYCACAVEHQHFNKLEPYLSQAIELTKQYSDSASLKFFAEVLVTLSQYEDDLKKKHQMVAQAFELQSKALQQHSDSNHKAVSQLYRLHSERPELENAQSLAKNLTLISSFGEYLSSHADFTDMVMRLYKDLNTIMPVDCLAIGMYDQFNNVLEYNQFVDLGELLPPFSIQCSNESTLSTYCINNKTPYIHGQFSSSVLNQLLEKTPTEQAFVGTTDEDYPSVIMVPLILEDSVLGVLTIQTHQHHAYQDYHFSLVKHLCSYIAIDIQNKLQKKQLEAQKKELKALVQIDPLSGLLNRLSLNRSLDRWRNENRQEHSLSVLLIDIDYYKQFNDSYGHVRGDEVLVQVATILKRCFDERYDKVFRYGGDEFLILSKAQSKSLLETKVKDLLFSVKAQMIEHKSSLCSENLTLSIGGAVFPNHMLGHYSNEGMLHQADEALYTVKRKGRDGAHIEYAKIIEHTGKLTE